MENNAIPVSEKTTIIVKASGDLFLQGVDQNEVRFLSGEERIRVHQSNDTLYVETHASLDISVPRQGNIIIEKVGGSAFIEDILQSLVIQKIGGDLALRNLSAVRIEKVGGGCLAEGIYADLMIQKIGGDLTLRQSTGAVMVETVGGDANIQATGAFPVTARSGGDLHLYLMESVSDPVTLRAGGDLEIFLPPNVNGIFTLASNGEQIELSMRNQAEVIEQQLEMRRHQFSLGEGGGRVEAQAGGDLRIKDTWEEPEPISDVLDRRENAWTEARDRRGFPSWSAGYGFDRNMAWADMISRRAQEASRRAEQRAQAAIRRTEEQIRQAAEREYRRVDVRPSQPPVSEPVSDQERVMVLKMLQEQKITVEQAEKLLAALEGRFNP